MPTNVPQHLHLDLSKHGMRNVSRLRLRTHTLKAEAAAWLEDGSRVCDQCPGEVEHVQNEVHALLLRRNLARRLSFQMVPCLPLSFCSGVQSSRFFGLVFGVLPRGASWCLNSRSGKDRYNIHAELSHTLAAAHCPLPQL